jgi:hypothetical protein
LVVFLLLASLVPVLPAAVTRAAGPQTYLVTTTNDDPTDANCVVDHCTLRQAVNASNANDPGTGNHNTIQFRLPGGPQVIELDTHPDHGTILITTSVTITGAGVENLAVDGRSAVSVFEVRAVGITLDWLTIQNGNTPSQSGGSGIFVDSSSALTLTGCTLTGNVTGGSGGGIFNVGALTVINTTLSGNTAAQDGGGIYNGFLGTLTAINSTIVGNAAATGGGIGSDGATALTDTLIAATTSGGALSVVNGGSFTGTNNVIDDAAAAGGFADGVNGNIVGHTAHLDPGGLQANGSTGPRTIALLRNSPAIEMGGVCSAGVTTDARGQARVGACDIGAYEYQSVTPTLSDAVGPAGGGSVTFSGTGFQTGSHLTIGGTTLIAPVDAVSDDGTRMTLAIPAHAVGSIGMALANPGSATPAAATITYVPVVSAVGPSSGGETGGVSVTISGAGFGTNPTQVRVTFGAVPATVRGVSDASIRVTTPAHAPATVDVTVVVNGVSGTKAGAYMYGTVSPLPGALPPGMPGGPTVSLPAARPVGATGGPTPSPLPGGRS